MLINLNHTICTICGKDCNNGGCKHSRKNQVVCRYNRESGTMKKCEKCARKFNCITGNTTEPDNDILLMSPSVNTKGWKFQAWKELHRRH
jgi:hypothetical protein